MAKGKYINLDPATTAQTDTAAIKFSLDSQVVRMKGKTWGWVWHRPRGIILQRGEKRTRVPIIDVSRWAQVLMYGLSALLVAIGVIKRFSSKGGRVNGG